MTTDNFNKLERVARALAAGFIKPKDAAEVIERILATEIPEEF